MDLQCLNYFNHTLAEVSCKRKRKFYCIKQLLEFTVECTVGPRSPSRPPNLFSNPEYRTPLNLLSYADNKINTKKYQKYNNKTKIRKLLNICLQKFNCWNKFLGWHLCLYLSPLLSNHALIYLIINWGTTCHKLFQRMSLHGTFWLYFHWIGL